MHPFGTRTALIGQTGFVGSNLAAQHRYTAHFNSKNIADIAGRTFDTIVCSGVQAIKYWANQNPDEDWQGIQRLLTPLESVTAGRFILLSTIDVYNPPVDVTEADPASYDNHAYGRHRRAVEAFVRERFPVSHVVRLPGLFGPGLKKNVIYDLLHRNCLEVIQPASAFQYYHLKHLTADLLKVLEHGIPILNLATEPVQTQTILDHFAPHENVGSKAGAPGRYDFRSQYDHHWGGQRGYLYEADAVLTDMADFFTTERARTA
jgi:nucleoside-diphosphate-sugar epimerase